MQIYKHFHWDIIYKKENQKQPVYEYVETKDYMPRTTFT